MTSPCRLGLLAATALTLAGCLPAHLPLFAGAEGRPLEIVGVEAPSEARAGTPVTVSLRARLYGRCWRVADARAAMDGAARTVTLSGTASQDPALSCAETGTETGQAAAVREEVVSVTFTPLAAGTYRFEVPHGIERARLERTLRVVE